MSHGGKCQETAATLFPDAMLEKVTARRIHHGHTHTLHSNVQKKEHLKCCPHSIEWFFKLNVGWCTEMNGF